MHQYEVVYNQKLLSLASPACRRPFGLVSKSIDGHLQKFSYSFFLSKMVL
jgi:hypothetical protein